MTGMAPAELTQQFREAMAASGVPYVGHLIADGVCHRFYVEGDRAGSRNGWYVLYADDRPAGAFGSWRHGQTFKWSAKGSALANCDERRALAERAAKARKARTAAEQERWSLAAEQAKAMWVSAEPATEHPYLAHKGVAGHGLRIGDFIRHFPPGPNGEARSKCYPGALLIPLWDSRKDIWNLQAIFPEPVVWREKEVRGKAFIFGARKQGLWYAFGRSVSEPDVAALTEGYATGATIHEATGLPILVAFDAGNLAPVAKEARRLLPRARLLVAADNDQWTTIDKVKRNVGVEKASLAATLSGGELIIPRFTDVSGKPTDFNDLQRLEGEKCVKRQFDEHLGCPSPQAQPHVITAPEMRPSMPTADPLGAAQAAGKSGVIRQLPPRAGLGGDKTSEDAMAEQFASEMQPTLRFCHSQGGWFLWDGTIWRRDLAGKALDLTRQAVRRMSAQEEKPAKFRSTRFVSGVASFVSRDPRLSRTSTDWDANRMLLGTPGQVVDLSSGRPLAPDPNYGITRSTTASPASAADCPQWLEFLTQTTGGDCETIGFLKRFFGSCLTGDTRDQTLLFIHGDGGNGKGVFMDIIREILGSYATDATTDMLMDSKYQKHSTDLAMLKGARLVVASETDQGTTWAESRIKLMTGSDPITARFMRQDNFTYLPEFKLVVIGNHMPTLKNVDSAMRRRFRIVPFTHKPTSVDKQLRQKLQAEAPAILGWLLDGCLEWQRDGLGDSRVIQEATQSYLGEQDLHSQWLEECCVVRRGDDSTRAQVAELYGSFHKFAKAAGEDPGSRKALSIWLTGAGFTQSRTSHVRMMKGLRLRTDHDG
jgi:putative DNA primase/helicase